MKVNRVVDDNYRLQTWHFLSFSCTDLYQKNMLQNGLVRPFHPITYSHM